MACKEWTTSSVTRVATTVGLRHVGLRRAASADGLLRTCLIGIIALGFVPRSSVAAEGSPAQADSASAVQARQIDSASSVQVAPVDETVGVPWTGERGITETVEQIMQREALMAPLSAGKHREAEGPFVPNNPDRRQNPDSPLVSQWPRTTREVSSTESLLSPQTLGTSFKTISISEAFGFIPPDTMGDVGPTQILSIGNGRIKVFSKAGVLGGLNADPDVFFNSVGGASGTSDPHIRYDRLSGRWFVVMINLTTPNRVLIAVSNSATITNASSFTFFQFQHDLVGTTPNSDTGGFLDYPTLGVDKNALYIGGNIVNSAGTALIGTTGFVVNKANLIAGSLTVTAFRQMSAGVGSGPESPQGVDNDDPGATQGYFIGADAATFSTLMIRRVSNPGGTPTISANISLTVPTTYFPLTAQPAKSSSIGLDGIDDRLFAAAIHKNKITGAINLWTAHNIRVSTAGVGGSTGTRNGSRWYEITNLSTTPSLVQSGTLFDSAASNPRGFWMPSVIISGQGHMALGSSYASVNDFASIAASGRLRTDTLGTTQAATLALASATAYNVETGVSAQRWGDFSQTDVDPNDDQTIWTFQEYCDASNSWGIRAIQLKAPPPAAPASATSACTGLSSTSVTVTGTSSAGSEFFDPGTDPGGPGYTNHLAASVTGGVVVNNVTFTDPTHVTLNINTTAAPAGTKDVTITNPDGQNATGVNILTINTAPTGLTASNNGPICAGGTLQLSASTIAGATYSWSGPNGFASTLQNPTIPGATTAATGTYSVTASAGGCSSTPTTSSATVIANGAGCTDGSACTTGDACSGGACSGSPVVCTPLDQCHVAGVCNPGSGLCSNPNAMDGSPCSDGNNCTGNDACSGGACTGTPLTIPNEVADLQVLVDKQTLVWSTAAAAGPGTVHDVPRGLVSELPVGSGGSEICLATVAAATTSDGAVPAADQSFWYLVRGRNSCGTGSYGTTSGGSPRSTSVCP